MKYRYQFVLIMPKRKAILATRNDGEIEVPQILKENFESPLDVVCEICPGLDEISTPRVIRVIEKKGEIILTYLVFVDFVDDLSNIKINGYYYATAKTKSYHSTEITSDTEDILSDFAWPLEDMFENYKKSKKKNFFSWLKLNC